MCIKRVARNMNMIERLKPFRPLRHCLGALERKTQEDDPSDEGLMDDDDFRF